VERPEDIVGSTFVFVQVWFVSVSVTTWFEMPWFEMPWNSRKTAGRHRWINLSVCSGVVGSGSVTTWFLVTLVAGDPGSW
jgi:hypothetical protein